MNNSVNLWIFLLICLLTELATTARDVTAMRLTSESSRNVDVELVSTTIQYSIVRFVGNRGCYILTCHILHWELTTSATLHFSITSDISSWFRNPFFPQSTPHWREKNWFLLSTTFFHLSHLYSQQCQYIGGFFGEDGPTMTSLSVKTGFNFDIKVQ